jgi:DNA mismatch repair protein MutS
MSSIYSEYFQLTEEYMQKYGQRTVVFMQVGTFFEIYGVRRSNGSLDKSIIEEVSLHGNLAITEKKNSNDKYVAYESDGNIVCSGFRDYSLEKYLPKLTDNGITVVVFVQESDGKKFKRVFHSVYSPGTYLSYETDTSTRMTNHTMCIWIDIIKPRLCKSTSVVGERTRDLLIYGASVVNIFTGQSSLFEHETVHLMNPTTFDELERFVSVYSPSEIVFVSPLSVSEINQVLQFAGVKTSTIHRIDSGDLSNEPIQRCMQQKYMKYMISVFYDEDTYDQHPDFSQYPLATQSFCYLLHFIQEHNPYLVRKIALPYFHNTSKRMVLANHTLKQLNIIDDTNAIEETANRKWGVGGITSVASFLNKCCTPMGRRAFYSQIVNPVFDEAWLQREYAMIGNMLATERYAIVPFLRIQLKELGDLEKISRQLTARRIYPNSIYKLFKSLQMIEQIHVCFVEYSDLCDYLSIPLSSDVGETDSHRFFADICKRLLELISTHLAIDKCKDVQSMHTFEENIICGGVSPKLDELLTKQTANQELFDAIRHSLNSLLRKQENTPNTEYVKIHETDKLGGSLQITKKRGSLFKKYLGELSAKNPQATIRITDKVSIPVSEIRLTSGANKTNDEIECPLINRICREIQEVKDAINHTIQEVYADFLTMFEQNGYADLERVSVYVARMDILQSKTYMAKEYHYCCPELVSQPADTPCLPSYVKAYDLRHCLIEHIQQNEIYVANDLCLGDCSATHTRASTADKETMSGMLLYGVNAVGKTSLIRALGIAVIMAQAGMYVPCSRFEYRAYRSIYSRILGNDNLFKGLSTFAVEMSELRMILKMADSNSLILGDELCSGTETESALSIFTAGLMDLHEKNASFVFATHFHEILLFEEIAQLSRLSVHHMAVHFDREKDCLVYDRKLLSGVGPSSYGIEVCKSLYLPEPFLEKTYRIRNRYFPKTQGGLAHDPAKTYNTQKIRGICEKCLSEIGEETHHLLEQKGADANGYIGGVHKNHPANLMSLCAKCHTQMHVDQVTAVRKKTTNGYRVDL